MNSIIISAMAWATSLRSSVVESLKREDGQDLVEYAVLIGGIAVVALVALLALGTGDGTPLWNFKDKIAACVQFDTANCS